MSTPAPVEPIREFDLAPPDNARLANLCGPLDENLHLIEDRMETGRPMVRAASDGVSAVIGYHGEIVVSAPEYEANVMRGTLQPRIGLTPYARTGNWPAVCLALVFGFVAAWLGRRRRPA